MSDTTNESNPAITVDKLIKTLDDYLSSAGVTTVAIAAAADPDKTTTDFLNAFAGATQSAAYIKLSKHYEKILEIVAEIIAELDEEPYFSSIQLPDFPDIGHDKINNLKTFVYYVVSVKKTLQPVINDEVGSNNKNQFLSAIKNKKAILNKGFFYEFTDGDLKRIQQIINELRSQITESTLFEDGHKQRLLRRLEAMQSEMHKKMSDVDKIWGLVGDAGVVVGKFGKDAKPFVDRIKELSKIAWRTQARAEELPSDSQNPLLGNDTSED